MEVHIQADPAKVHFLAEKYQQRSYFGNPTGEFDCGDYRISRVWRLGIDTMRSCSEDAVIDNPTRERGQWTGDVMLSMFIAAVGFQDVRLFRRAIQQSAWCARSDGMVAGLCPGGLAFISTYAAEWFTSTMNYYRMTGDKALLREMFPYAERNAAAFEKAMTPRGVNLSLAWPFIDWGFAGDPQAPLNLHLLEGLRNFCRWSILLNKNPARYQKIVIQLENIITQQLRPKLAKESWNKIGYHAVVLAFRNGFIQGEKRAAAIRFLKTHIMACFPNNAAAPRLSNPGVQSHQLITPYFSYYAFPPLIESGAMDFVLDQYRTCWGWALDQGLTTQPEVFDLNWSHCHAWAASPTAQLSHYLLGLRACYARGRRHFDLRLIPGSLKWAAGKAPLLFEDDTVTVDWRRQADGQFAYHLHAPQAIWLHAPVLHAPGQTKPIRIKGHVQLLLAADSSIQKVL